MPATGMTIRADGLTKRYGPALAVDGLSFEVLPGRVTGFLGPNGAGKSTTMRLILGLDAPTRGTVTVGGVAYRRLRRPLFQVGTMLESRSVHPGRSARAHLLALAQANAIPGRRVDEVLGLVVGLERVAGRPAGSFSLGMTQRLGVATALLGDPGMLLLDEPVNGLDPEGVAWIRTLLRNLAAEGRTVFVSSHLLSEMAQTADQVIVIGRGRLITDASIQELLRGSSEQVRVRSPKAQRLAEVLRGGGATVETDADGALLVRGVQAAAVGELAACHGIALHELVARQASLEEAFMELTRDAVDYQRQRTRAGKVP